MKPFLIVPDSPPQAWRRTALRKLGHDEVFLEKIVAASPEVLGLDPYETGVGKSFVAFRQTHLTTPTGRTVIPDVVLLSESGHIVIVEAKLGDNPELKDRRVVAQVVEYAASVANLSDDDLLAWLRADEDESWLDFVKRQFPKAEAPDRLAAALRRRIKDAELHLVIVSDEAPDGLRDLVRAVAGQAALGAFQLHVVELVPWVADGVPGVLLVPSQIAKTEIVARTAITVNYTESKQSGVSIVASSGEEVAEAIAQVRSGQTMRPEFAAVIERYDSTASEELRTIGGSPKYRQVHPSDWPRGIHYEFLDRSGGSENVGVELHAESKSLSHLRSGFEALAMKIGATFEENWQGVGVRVFKRVPAAEPEGVGLAMKTFIDQTREEATKLLLARDPSA